MKIKKSEIKEIIRQTLNEITSGDIEELEAIVKELEGASKMHQGQSEQLAAASKMHKGQSERIDKIIKSVSKTDEELSEEKNCGCGQNPCITYGKQNVKEGFDLKKLEIVIKSIQKKIAKQGRVTNARDEEHLKQLIKVYKNMGGRKIKEGKLNEAKETIFDVAKRVMKDKQAYKYKTKKGLVTVDMQTANLLTKVFKKVNPKMKKILSDLGYKSPTQLMNTLWAVAR